MLSKPSVARFKNVYVTATAGSTRQLATDACEVVSVLVTAGGSAVTVRVVDSKNVDAGYSPEDGFSIAARSSDSQSYTPCQPTPMKNGLAVVFEQGEGSNGEVLITYN